MSAAALWLLLTGPAQLFGFDGGQAGMLKLQWARPFVIANLLVFALTHWRDRR